MTSRLCQLNNYDNNDKPNIDDVKPKVNQESEKVQAGNDTHQFAVAEGVDAIAGQRFAVEGPSEFGNGVTLHWSGNAQLLAFIHGHISHGPSEGWCRPKS